ncbi:hypothetical protein [Sorangium sp. So ce341]|uniref:hypothetical protein n=1 Tax=Sorangium sp. So ce341 TaxID=3133302 RepID=UPI003F626B08
MEEVLEEVGGFAYGLQWLGERLLREGDVDEECTDRRLVRVEDAERVHESRRGRHRRGRIGWANAFRKVKILGAVPDSCSPTVRAH